MKNYKVQWSKNAIYDLEDIIEYIKIDSIKLAKDIFYEIKEECQKLCFSPQRKRIVPELKQLGITKYIDLIYKKWRIIFKIQEDEVFILLVVDSSRNLEDILYQRLLKG